MSLQTYTSESSVLGSSVDLYLPFRSFCQGGAAAQWQENQEKEDVSQAKYTKSLLQ